MKKRKIKIHKFNEQCHELKVSSECFDLGYIDSSNSYLSLNLGRIKEHFGSCSLGEMQRRLKTASKELAQDIKNLNKIVEEIEKVKKSKEYKKLKIINKKST